MPSKEPNKQKVSIVVPVLNEEQVVDQFIKKVDEVLHNVDFRYEIIFVDDGSDDSTVINITKHFDSSQRIKLVKLSRNFGKEIAILAGLDHLTGDCAVIIDVDLQDPPELIIEFVKLWRLGYENVYGVRTERNEDTWSKRVTAKSFYYVFNKLAADRKIPVDAGDFRLLSLNVVNALKSCREKHRFMKGLYSWVGYKSASVSYVRPSRIGGKTSFNSKKLISLATDGIIAHSRVLLRISTYTGLIFILISMILAFWLLLEYFLNNSSNPQGFYLTVLLILSLFSVNFFMIGVLGEYVWRIYDEVKDRPLYIVDQERSLGINCNEKRDCR